MATYDAQKEGPTGISTKISIDKIMGSANLCELLSDEDLKYIGSECYEGYQNDLDSRKDWEKRHAEANKLALQVYEAKTFPWPNASSVKFPLITVAALQFQARAYSALVNANDLVKCRVIGEDPTGEKAARAKRISTHMTWQNLEQDKAWEEEHDKMLLVEAIAGTAFKKKVFEPGPGHNITMLVLPENLVVNYFARDLASCQRYTHHFYLNANNIKQRELDGRFMEIKDQPAPEQDTEITEAKDEEQGTTKPPQDKATPFFTGEQYCWWDLDGDGYEEPYIVTFDIASQQVRRIVARFLPSGIKVMGGKKWKPGSTEDVYKITPVEVFTKYTFIPSPDGGFYDIGLGSILGPINDSVNTAINQIFDAATMASLGGGFVGRGFKNKGGPITFQPNQWYPVDAPGDDLRKSIVPLPVPQPSDVLFKVLGLLLQYGERIVSANDLQMGENIGQNTPAHTAETMNKNGARVYNAIYKRNWRSERDEFRIQYALNEIYLEANEEYEDLTTGKGAMIRPDDYTSGSSLDVRPAADPHIVSDNERLDQAKMILENSLKIPGHNRYQSILRFYKALNVPNIEEILPQPTQPGQPGPDGKPGQPVPIPDFPPPPNPKMMEIQIKGKAQELKEKEFQASQMTEKIELQMAMAKNQAEIIKLQAQAIKLAAEAKGAEMEPHIKLLFAEIEASEKHQKSIQHLMDIVDRSMERSAKYANTEPAGGAADNTAGDSMAPMGAGPTNPAVPPLPKAGGRALPGVLAPGGLPH